MPIQFGIETILGCCCQIPSKYHTNPTSTPITTANQTTTTHTEAMGNISTLMTTILFIAVLVEEATSKAMTIP